MAEQNQIRLLNENEIYTIESNLNKLVKHQRFVFDTINEQELFTKFKNSLSIKNLDNFESTSKEISIHIAAISSAAIAAAQRNSIAVKEETSLFHKNFESKTSYDLTNKIYLLLSAICSCFEAILANKGMTSKETHLSDVSKSLNIIIQACKNIEDILIFLKNNHINA